jgi:hypothetical protein
MDSTGADMITRVSTENLFDCPIVSLFGSGMGSTGPNMIVKSVNSKLCETTSREW